LTAPRLALSKFLAFPDEWKAPDELVEMISSFHAVADRSRLTRKLATDYFRDGVEPFIEGAKEAWRAGAALVEDARTTEAEVARLRSEVVTRTDELRAQAMRSVGWPKATAPTRTSMTDLIIASDLLDAGRLVTAIESTSPNPELIETWREGILDIPVPADIWRLVEMAQSENRAKQELQHFQRAIIEYARNADRLDLISLLMAMTADELVALVREMRNPPWTLGAAILLRAAIDSEGPGLPDGVIRVLLSEREAGQRRSLLRFLDPTSSSLDTHIALRRVVAAERLRDARYFGPLAEISDPTSGLSDAGLVGRTIFEIAELVTKNLALVSHGSDLQRLLRPTRRSGNAANALSQFVQSPSTMTGNFRRLRESARNTLLVPILRGDHPNFLAATMLAKALGTSDPGDEVFTQVQSERPDDRLQHRHRQQLDRYLEQARRLLIDFIDDCNYTPDGRHKDLQRSLNRLRAQLKIDGAVGSIEWLEGQVAAMLDASAPAPSYRTLTGDSRPASRRLWDEEDEVSESEKIDLPEFHLAQRPNLIEVAAGVLRWKHLTHAASRRDIVEELVKRREFAAGLMVAEEDPVSTLSGIVRAAGEPAVRDLRVRLAQIVEKHGEDAVHCCNETKLFEAALSRMNIDTAAEHLDVIELDLAAATAAGEDDEATRGREDRLRSLLLLAGAGTADDRAQARDLETSWTDELVRRSSERQHLLTVETAFAGVEAALPELAAAIEAFREGNLRADRWLPKDLASNFDFLVEEPASKLASWAAAAAMFRVGEREALSCLCGWFIDFVAERALTIHFLEDAVDVDVATDQPWLHQLRPRSPGFVRRLRRYYSGI
jgi:hypothetical protein